MNVFLSEYDITIEMPQPVAYIYCITNTVSQKQYVGQTKSIQKRVENHLQGKGSRPLLKDIVKQGVSDFKFEVLELIYGDRNVDAVEDDYIDRLDCLHPRGYNLRVNATIIANDEMVNLNMITIQAKFCFKDGEDLVFSVGQFTQARAYQVLANLKHSTETKKIKQKKLFGFSYFEMRVRANGDFTPGELYDIALKYKFHADHFILV